MRDIAFETVSGIVYKARLIDEDNEKLIVNDVDIDGGNNLRIPNVENPGVKITTNIEFYKDKLIWISRQ